VQIAIGGNQGDDESAAVDHRHQRLQHPRRRDRHHRGRLERDAAVLGVQREADPCPLERLERRRAAGRPVS
jgi:hypothetical protein